MGVRKVNDISVYVALALSMSSDEEADKRFNDQFSGSGKRREEFRTTASDMVNVIRSIEDMKMGDAK